MTQGKREGEVGKGGDEGLFRFVSDRGGERGEGTREGRVRFEGLSKQSRLEDGCLNVLR